MHDKENDKEEMHHREIILPDGRYMVFYTFGDEEELKKEKNDQKEDV
jgi:hypothetical protein